MRIGVLAYGSLLDDPGDELARLTVGRLEGVLTPFHVELARSSTSRDGAPTLVPVEHGGAPVGATILELDASIGETGVREALFRRESRRPDASLPADGPSWIRAIDHLAGVDRVMYTALEANIAELDADGLARLAVLSAAKDAGAAQRDGISYLIAQLERGIRTPLAEPYAAAILRRTGAVSLRNAWRTVRADPDRFTAPAP
jgi:hypothetical protein